MPRWCRLVSLLYERDPMDNVCMLYSLAAQTALPKITTESNLTSECHNKPRSRLYSFLGLPDTMETELWRLHMTLQGLERVANFGRRNLCEISHTPFKKHFRLMEEKNTNKERIEARGCSLAKAFISGERLNRWIAVLLRLSRYEAKPNSRIYWNYLLQSKIGQIDKPYCRSYRMLGKTIKHILRDYEKLSNMKRRILLTEFIRKPYF